MSLSSFIKKALDKEGGNKKQEYSLGQISEEEAKKINESTGHNVEGFERTIDNYAINHTIKKHGEKQKEEHRGQVQITEEELNKIPEILENTGTVKDVGKSNIGQPLIQSTSEDKENGGTFLYTEAVRQKKKKLSMKTLYKRGK